MAREWQHLQVRKRTGQYGTTKALSAVAFNCPACPTDESEQPDLRYGSLFDLTSLLKLLAQLDASSLANRQFEECQEKSGEYRR